MAASSLIAWNNLAKSAVITASSAASGMLGANVAQDQGAAAMGWQTGAGVTFLATLTIKPGVRTTGGVAGIFRTNLTPGASVTFQLFNNPSTLITGIVSGVARGYGQAIAVISPTTSWDYIVVNVSDSGNPDGFLNVPLAFVGPAWYPSIGIGWNSSYGRDDMTDEVVARGGQEFPVNRWTRRRFEMRLEGIRQSEFWAQQGELDRYARAGSNVLVVPNVASATLNQEAVFGRLKSTADVTFPSMAGDARAWSASITERL